MIDWFKQLDHADMDRLIACAVVVLCIGVCLLLADKVREEEQK